MGDISTFGLFSVAKLGIYSAQKAMEVTGNNITNINTDGYTRQRVDQSSLFMGGSDRYSSAWDARVGSGAIVNRISQVRDPYLDIRYRTTMADVGAANELLDGYNQLASIFDEVGKGNGDGVFELQMNDLISQIQRLVTEGAGKDDYDTLVRGSASSLVSLFNTYADKLEELKNNQINSFNKDIDTVNNLLTKIQELNVNIRKSEIHGGQALELKDLRNTYIDQLSEFMRIDVTYEEEDVGGGVTVDKLVIKLAGEDPDSPYKQQVLVNGNYVTQVSWDQKLGADGLPDPAEAEYNNQFWIKLDALKDQNNRVLETSYNRTALGRPELKAVVEPGDGVRAKYASDFSNLTDADITAGTYKISVAGRVASVTLDDNNATVNGLLSALAAQLNGKVDDGMGGKYAVTVEGSSLAFEAQNPGTADAQNTALSGTAKLNNIDVTYSEPVILGDNDLYGSLQSSRELLTEEGEFSSTEAVGFDPKATTKRGIPYYQNMLDALANKFATVMNQANTLPDDNVSWQDLYMDADTQAVLDKDGNMLEMQLMDENGAVYNPKVTVQFGTANETDADGNSLEGKFIYQDDNGDWQEADFSNIKFGYTETDAGGNSQFIESTPVYNKMYSHYNGGPLFSNRGDGNDTTGITAANISISDAWSTGAVRVLCNKNAVDPSRPESTNNSNLTHILYLIQEGYQDYKPGDIPQGADAVGKDTTYFSGTFQGMLTEISSTLANDTRIVTNKLQNHVSAANDLYMDRDSVSGVDLNDEAMAMMQYNKAYSASCRLLTTIDEMLDKLINGTAI